MKLNAIAPTVAFTVFASAASAGDSSQPLQTITVSARPIAECVRFNQPRSNACKLAAQLIRANFTPTEIRTIARWQATHPLYLFDEIYALHDRFEAVSRAYVARQKAAKPPTTARRIARN